MADQTNNETNDDEYLCVIDVEKYRLIGSNVITILLVLLLIFALVLMWSYVFIGIPIMEAYANHNQISEETLEQLATCQNN